MTEAWELIIEKHPELLDKDFIWGNCVRYSCGKPINTSNIEDLNNLPNKFSTRSIYDSLILRCANCGNRQYMHHLEEYCGPEYEGIPEFQRTTMVDNSKKYFVVPQNIWKTN